MELKGLTLGPSGEQRVGHRFYSRGKMLVDLGLTQHVKYTRSIMLLSKTFKFLLSSSFYR